MPVGADDFLEDDLALWLASALPCIRRDYQACCRRTAPCDDGGGSGDERPMHRVVLPAEAPTNTACHHASATTLGIKDADKNCDGVLAISPFVKEETQQIIQAVLPANTPLSAFMSVVGVALLAYGRDVDPAAARRATSPLVLRL
jgi:hypothetical protein